MELLKSEVGSTSDPCETSTVDAIQLTGMEAERVSNIKQEVVEEPTQIPLIKTEPDNSFCFVDCGTGSCSETRVTCDVDGTEEVSIKVEEAIDIKDEMTESVTVPEMKTENENSFCFVECGTGSCSETRVPCGVDGTEEVSIKVEEAIDIKDEMTESLTVPERKTENEGSLNEQLHVHSAECRKFCVIRRGKRPYLCEICNKAFSKKCSLIRHHRIHSGERPYSCEVCNMAFSEQSNLVTHQRKHSGERPYNCAVCNRAFSDQSCLRRHQRIHSGERPYACSVCSKAFSDQSCLIRHRRIHSGERPYACAFCNKRFSDQSSLISHRRTHSGERPYRCEVCNKSFGQKSNLITHQRMHSGERPYACAVCNEAFRLKSTLVTHLQIHSVECAYN